MSYRKGSRSERELQYRLYADGFSVVRVAGSGRSRMPSPDLIAMKSGKTYAIECKATGKDMRSIPKSDLEILRHFCERGGCIPVIAIKFDRRGWRFYNLDDRFHIKNGRDSLFQTKLQ